MSFDGIVEVKNSFPSPFGGAIFTAVPEGERRYISFRASSWTITRAPATGEFWNIKGEIEKCDEYGNVVVVDDAFLTALPSFKYVGNFLKNHRDFRGFYFGNAKVDMLIQGIGDYALVDILNKSNYLALVDAGLSEPLAQKVCEVWSELKDETEVATFLSDNELESSLAKKIIRLCKFDTVQRLKRNPYGLLALSSANKSDLNSIYRVAEKLGISSNDRRAVVGCVEFVMYQELDRSNTIVDINLAHKLVTKALGWIKSGADANNAIKMALEEKSICVLEMGGVTYLQAIGVAYIEQFVEDKLTKLQQLPLTSNAFTDDHKALTKRLEQYNEELYCNEGYRLNNEQKSAVIMALTNRVSVLSGYGGTGKTTVLKAIVDLAKTQLRQVIVAALAGKAANRASQSIGETAYTIHSLINSIKRDDGTVAMDSDPLIILDESSMIDISLVCVFLRLFEDHKVRFMFVGDTAQLAPIGFGLFYHRLIETNVSQVKLIEVHRTTSGSPLHSISMSIRDSKTTTLPRYTGQSSGVYLLSPEINPYLSLIELRRVLDCMILTPYSSSKFEASTSNLNPAIQNMVNRPDEGKPSLALGNTIIGVGDPVLITKSKGRDGIFNGMTGFVTSVQSIDNEVRCNIQFEGSKNTVQLTKEQCWEVGLQLAYAITIHKSQGSEYDVCTIVLGSPLIENSAIYTAITRTKRLCILVGSQQEYNEAVLRTARHKKIKSGFSPTF